MPQFPKTQLLPNCDFVLLHAGFLSKIAYLCRQYDNKVGEQSIVELKQLAKKIKKIKNISELEEFISKNQLGISKTKPENYYNNGYTNARHFFYFIPVSIENDDLGAICFFFPALFRQYNFSKELSCCTLGDKFFQNKKDVKLLEVFNATYLPPLRYTC
ncbi:hypothetical protein CL633_02970 [bacterium]|nr:hypothetical protein [bacterium]|tara:strand:- start:572 stop:1048 length:477 start_codon:yes stop_codon:yes gene_type:complete